MLDAVSVKFGNDFLNIRYLSQFRSEYIGLELTLQQVLNRILPINNLLDVGQGWDHPPPKLSAAKRCLAVVNEVQEGPFSRAVGRLDDL